MYANKFDFITYIREPEDLSVASRYAASPHRKSKRATAKSTQIAKDY
jgi:hypothetical protein